MKERLKSSEVRISIREFERVLPEICDAKISYVPGNWTPDNPLHGTCVPVALVAQRFFGGRLLRAELKPFPKYKYMGWHWVNLLPNGKVKDFTKQQFGSDYPQGMEFVEKPPYSILRHPDVKYRTNLLYRRLLRVI
ncbi:MAG TPA: hypothetical protein VJ227_02125 [Patescibacteria group bacterium]|nr:hypothetical protein [Patescibacteria group bacterium]